MQNTKKCIRFRNKFDRLEENDSTSKFGNPRTFSYLKKFPSEFLF